MRNLDSLLNPSNIRAKQFGGPPASGDDAGAMLVEAMIYFAVVILIAGQIIPELMKALERAEVDNLRAAVTTLSNDIQMDHAYTGVVMYTTAEVKAAVDKFNLNKPGEMTFTYGLTDSAKKKSVATKDSGYWVAGESSNSANFCVRFSSTGFQSGTGAAMKYSQFQVLTPKTACAVAW